MRHPVLVIGAGDRLNGRWKNIGQRQCEGEHCRKIQGKKRPTVYLDLPYVINIRGC